MHRHQFHNRFSSVAVRLAGWRGNVVQAEASLLDGTVRHHRSSPGKRDVVPRAEAAKLDGKRRIEEKLWTSLFSDPLQWWDRRAQKTNSRSPDFKHKKTGASLWLDGNLTPRWVEARLASLSPTPVQGDIFAWNARLSRCVKGGHYERTLSLFRRMLQLQLNLTTYSFVPVLNACSGLGLVDEGRHIHAQLVESGLESDIYVGNALVDMYSKCGSIEDAWSVFDRMPKRDVVSWNVMILGFVKCGQALRALELFKEMQRDGPDADGITVLGAVNACASLMALEEGKRVHERIIKSGYESDIYLGSSLVDMYAKCGSLEDAWRVFNKMPRHDLVSWNAMIHGHVKCGQGQKALDLSQQMQGKGLDPNPVTFVGMLNACASEATLEQGKRIHGQTIQRGFESHPGVVSALVDMYAKCGSIEDAQSLYDKMSIHNFVTCTAMLGAYAMHGHAREALNHFERMCQEDVEVNEVTFTSLLSACSRVGLVDEGLHYFNSMSGVYGVPVSVEHYSCIVDLLSRAGRLEEAEDLIKAMPREPTISVWMSLLGACRVHGKLAMGERIAERVLELNPNQDAGYVLLSNIYAAAGRWDRSAKLQQRRLKLGVKKEPGRSWLEVANVVHTFRVDDREHPRITEIRKELERVSEQLKWAGYEPDTTFVLHDVDDKGKFSNLLHHSEKLAIAFGLISTQPDYPIRVFKNLRMCGDCHNFIKAISGLVGREIVVRDTSRFHHFVDGFCSCGEYW